MNFRSLNKFTKSLSLYRNLISKKTTSHCSCRVHAISSNRLQKYGKQIIYRIQSQYSTLTESEADYDIASKPREYSMNSDSLLAFFKNLLYPDSENEIMSKLKSCNDVKEVLDIIEKTPDIMVQHLAQSVLMLRYLQKCDRYQFDEDYKKYSFNKLIISIQNSADEMNFEELSCCILYLYKIVPERSMLMPLISVFQDKTEKAKTDVPLSSLARYCITIKEFENLWSLFALSKIITILKTKLIKCDNHTDFRRLTICFQKTVPLLSDEIMETYVNKCSMLLEKKCDEFEEEERIRTIIRATTLLNFNVWERKYFSVIRTLLLSIGGNLNMLNTLDLEVLHHVAYLLREPYSILQEIKQLSFENLSSFSDKPCESLYWCWFQFMFLGDKNIQRENIRNCLKSYLDSPNISSSSSHLNIALSILTNCSDFSDQELVDKYWNKVIMFVENIPEDQKIEHMLFYCKRYIDWCSIPIRYNKNFETLARSWLYQIRSKKGVTLNVADTCKLNIYLLYFDKSSITLVPEVFEYLLSNIRRLSLSDISNLYHFLSSIVKNLKKHKHSQLFLHNYVQFISEMHNCTTEYVKKDVPFHDETLLQVFRNYINIGGTKFCELHRYIEEQITRIPLESLNSRKIRLLTPILSKCQNLEPVVFDQLIHYFIDKKDLILAISSVHLLNFMFIFGYTPSSRCEEFLKLAAELMYRDRKSLLSHYLMAGCLGLCYYDYFPTQLINYIFSVKFLHQVDEELKTPFQLESQKWLHRNLLDLNRTVCIGFPNSNVPWFHDRYCREKLTLDTFRKQPLHDEVLTSLKELIQNERAIQESCHSPYYHHIDFVVTTDKTGQPVDPAKCKPGDLRKIAILLNKTKTTTSYYLGKGRRELLVRQLEILGYKVVEIDKYQWNSMYMSEPEAKVNHLCNLIWSK